ncbi:uncharacterized protein DNG_05082 [Cephalotrichum gorgonifer]|uniref:Uncharacterized protein n=1 Tax=Cephalotrichum gorgonifer TaxID=2041049 RepID=A0AAE8MZC0_9PEZI|nr:uncharacterized protein DNG_05082 [Cephalotrichum gorgonifer]
MAPIRRYLRISKFSVLECRIYLDNPALAQSWLLNPRNPVLPRVIEVIQPLVLPKLREEKERARKKTSKKKGIKDVIETDEFEVSMFLTETTTRHSILRKHKHFRDKVPGRLQSNSNKLLGESNTEPIDVDEATSPHGILREEDDDVEVSLDNIPEIGVRDTRNAGQGKRPWAESTGDDGSDSDSDFEEQVVDVDADSDLEEESAPPSKRARQDSVLAGEDDDEQDDKKKKMAMDITYEGFAIYGMVLCLVVKRRETAAMSSARAARGVSAVSGDKPTGHAMMENWISSTQVPAGLEDDVDLGG